MKATIVFATVVALSAAACTAAVPSAGARLTLTGEIHVKGNEPHPTIMLETDDRTTWELSGVQPAEARSLAGRRVTAQGTVLRAPRPDAWLPILRVDEVPKPTTP